MYLRERPIHYSVLPVQSVMLTQEIGGALEALRAGKRPRVHSSAMVLQPPTASTAQAGPLYNSDKMALGNTAASEVPSARVQGVPASHLAKTAERGVATPPAAAAPLASAPSTSSSRSQSSMLFGCSHSPAAASVSLGASEEGPDGLRRLPSSARSLGLHPCSSLTTIPCSPAHGITRSQSGITVDTTTTTMTTISSGRAPKPPRASVFSPAAYPQHPQQQQTRPLLPPLPPLTAAPSSAASSAAATPAAAVAFQQPAMLELIDQPPLSVSSSFGAASFGRQSSGTAAGLCSSTSSGFEPAALLYSSGRGVASGISLSSPTSPSPSLSLSSAPCALVPPPPMLPQPQPPQPQYLLGTGGCVAHSNHASMVPVVPLVSMQSMPSMTSRMSTATPAKKRKTSRAAHAGPTLVPTPTVAAAASAGAGAGAGAATTATRRWHVHHDHGQGQPRVLQARRSTAATAAALVAPGAAATSAAAASRATGAATFAPLAAGLASTASLHPYTFTGSYFSNPSVVAQLQAMQLAVMPTPMPMQAVASGASTAAFNMAASAPALPAMAPPPTAAAAPAAAAGGGCTVPEYDPISAAALMLDLDSKDAAPMDPCGGFEFQADAACDPWAQLFHED